jgi:hypothetical protein
MYECWAKIDSDTFVVTSAKMTDTAYDENLELCVLCRGGRTARRVQQHFDCVGGTRHRSPTARLRQWT